MSTHCTSNRAFSFFIMRCIDLVVLRRKARGYRIIMNDYVNIIGKLDSQISSDFR